MEATDGEDKPTLREFWNSFNVRNATDNIADAWDEVSSYCVNAALRKLWPECIVNFPGFKEETPKNIQGKILELGNQLGLELELFDIEDLLESHN